MSHLKDNICSQCQKDPNSSKFDYYWRDYKGVIPKDAIVGGHDLNHANTYIGQGFYSTGLYPGTIYPGKFDFNITSGGYTYPSPVGVKILCSLKPECFSWLKADSQTLHATTIGQHVVIGGIENSKYINIGRASYQGETIVGKVVAYNAENAKLCFNYSGEEISLNAYEILIYTHKSSDWEV